VINLIVNDPLAADGPPVRSVSPRHDRPANRARITSRETAAEGRYAVGTPEFLFWQVREGALWAIEAWERATGETVAKWARMAKSPLPFVTDEGLQVNAYYDRKALRFYHYPRRGEMGYSGASVDIVSHEVGHAILDSMRPDLWDTPFPEVSAFHESFGDCVAMITGLSDPVTRKALMAGAPRPLTARNFLESWGEDLAAGIRAFDRSDNGAAPRRAVNKFKWKLPSALPDDGPPSVLINESHSLARVFDGCFYDAIRNVVADRETKTHAGLWNATKTVSSLLAHAVTNAPETARFFQTVGQAMVLADRAENDGRNVRPIEQAFETHGILLGSSALLAATGPLEGRPPSGGRAATGALDPSTRRDLLGRFGAARGSTLATAPIRLGKRRVVKAVHTRTVRLDGVDQRLRGVVARVPEAVIVGESGRSAATLAAFPDSRTTALEVETFVHSLLQFGCLDLDCPDKERSEGSRRGAARTRRGARNGTGVPQSLPTHTTRRKGSVEVLTRVRFACGAPLISRSAPER
jgi:hypothetical protein